MIKGLLGSALRSRETRTQNRETCLRAITHNLMILRRWVFYGAGATVLLPTRAGGVLQSGRCSSIVSLSDFAWVSEEPS